jgi:photosystem II stability/assembly factor-like uncharacterized protein
MNKFRKCVVIITLAVSNANTLNAQWELRYPDIPADHINDILFLTESIGFAVSSAGSVLMTTNGGDTWKTKAHYQRDVISDIEFLDSQNGFAISPYSHIGDDVSFLYTTDGGWHWNDANVSMGDALAFLPLSTSAVIKSTERGIIGKLNNFFGLWIETYKMRDFLDDDVTVPYGTIKQFQRLPGGRILALGSNDAAKRAGVISDSVSFILMSDDEGSSWAALWCDLPYSSYTFSFFNDSIGWWGAETDRIYKTTNGGFSWTLQYSDSTQTFPIRSISSPDGIFVSAVDGSGRVLSSTDSGQHWQFVQVDQHYDYPVAIEFLNPLKGFLASQDFWVTSNGGATWMRVSKSIRGNLRRIDFVSRNTGMGIGDNSIYRTTDGGSSWTTVCQSPTQFFSGLDMLDSLNIWITTHDSLYHSTDGGNSWGSLHLGNDIQYIRGIQFLDANTGIAFEVWEHDTTVNYVTTDGGSTWNKHTINDIQFFSSFSKIQFTDPRHLWFSNQHGAWLSTDTAKTWTLFPIERASTAFHFADSTTGWVSIWGGPFSKIAMTTNGGTSWQLVDRPYASQPEDMLSYKDGDYYGGVVLYVAGFEGSLTRFRQGDSYVYDIPTYTGKTLNSFATYREGNVLHMWVAGDGMIVLHETAVVTGIEEEMLEHISSFSLAQNYPNPFNPVTAISFSIPRRLFVSLIVYDLLGREVSTIVSEEMAAGNYTRQWNAVDLSSGVYFYRLQAGSLVETRKLVLLR